MILRIRLVLLLLVVVTFSMVGDVVANTCSSGSCGSNSGDSDVDPRDVRRTLSINNASAHVGNSIDGGESSYGSVSQLGGNVIEANVDGFWFAAVSFRPSRPWLTIGGLRLGRVNFAGFSSWRAGGCRFGWRRWWRFF